MLQVSSLSLSTRKLAKNATVKCENPAVPPRSVATVTEYLKHKYDAGNGRIVNMDFPFVNRKYRMDVRVCDFYPPDLKKFASRRRIKSKGAGNGLDLLSDDGQSDLDLASSEDDDDEVESATWEWDFWLELEDATPDVESPQSFWVFVNNMSGECLTSLDADNLEQNPQLLNKLRNNLWTLWGNLEEVKKAKTKASTAAKKSQFKGEAPPAHSDNDDDESPDSVSNKPFSCCIEQYGLQVAEEDPDKANARKGRRWERIYKLTGTRIV